MFCLIYYFKRCRFHVNFNACIWHFFILFYWSVFPFMGEMCFWCQIIKILGIWVFPFLLYVKSLSFERGKILINFSTNKNSTSEVVFRQHLSDKKKKKRNECNYISILVDWGFCHSPWQKPQQLIKRSLKCVPKPVSIFIYLYKIFP